jgi:cobalt-zinc-cadmium efflux system outer membrane protein
MRTRPWCVVVALVSAGAAPNVGAQSLPLTEAEALARLSPESPRVRAIRSGIDVARADVLAAGRWPNPRVTFDRESVAGVSENITMISQALPITGRRGFEVQAASALVDASSNRADEAMRRARADLRLAFAQLISAQARERELSSSSDRLRELAQILEKREAAGDAAGFDRLRAERELLEVETDRAAAATEQARAQSALAMFFADPVEPATIVAIDTSTAPAPLPPVNELVTRAESMRGELLALRKEIDAAQLSGRAAVRRRVPEPEIVAGTKSSTAAGGDVGSVMTIHASVPLFDRSRPERALAEARARQAEARSEVFRTALKSEIAALRAVVIERRETAERYRKAATSGAGQMERIAQVSYDAGERGILELLDAYRTASAARLRMALLDAAVRQAEIELEFVSGWGTP